MADGDTTPGTTTPEPPKGGDGGKTFTQDQVNDLIAREKGNIQRKYADYDDLRAKATKLDELEQASKSDLERVATERDKLKTQAEHAAAETLRLKVAVSKGLVGDRAWIADRLTGSTKEELEADADQFLERLKPATTSFDGGARGAAAPTDDMNARLRQAAGRQ